MVDGSTGTVCGWRCFGTVTRNTCTRAYSLRLMVCDKVFLLSRQTLPFAEIERQCERAECTAKLGKIILKKGEDDRNCTQEVPSDTASDALCDWDVGMRSG